MKNVLILAIILLVSGVATASEVITISSSGWVLLAADSFVSYPNMKSPVPECKLHQTGNIYWAATGIINIPETETAMKKAFDGSADLDSTLSNFIKLMTPEVQKSLPTIKKELPERYRALRRETNPSPMDIFAVQIRGSHPIESGISFLLVGDKIQPRIENGCKTVVIGHLCSVVSPDSIEVPKTPSDSRSMIALLYKLMVEGHAKDTAHIGGPTSILLLTAAGPRWIDKGRCEDIRTSQSDSPATIPEWSTP